MPTPGSGSGFSAAKGFVEAMGGTIRAEDSPGGGLTIIVSLPIYRPEASNGAAPAGEAAPAEVRPQHE